MKKRHKSKGQAAIEFIMRYAWAIMVFFVAIGALAYFGIINPAKFLPSSCVLEPGIGCVEFKVNQDSVVLLLRNGRGEDLNISSIKVVNCSGSNSGILKDGKLAQFIVEGCWNTPNTRFASQINITYTGVSGVEHTKIGKIYDNVEIGCTGACECANLDNSCGNYPSCANCNAQDWYSLNYCLTNDVYRNFSNSFCSNQQCTSALSQELVQTCTNGTCQNGNCICSNSNTSCGNFPSCNNCNSLDTYSQNYCTGNDVYKNFSDYGCLNQQCNLSIIPQLVQSCTNGTCSNGACACQNIDTNCGNYPSCSNCNSQDTYSANYCSGNSIYRNFSDYSCASQACNPTIIPQLQQNCASNNGICQSSPSVQCACANTQSSCGNYPSCQACGANQACQSNQCVTTTCSDGTPVNTCSSTKPQYCNSAGNLVNSCSTCGCPSGKACQGDGTCVNAVAQFSASYSNLQPPGSPGGQWFYDVTLRETGGIVGITVQQRQKCYSSSIYGSWCDSVRTDIIEKFGTNYILSGNQIIWYNNWIQPTPGQTFTVTETFWGVDGNNNNVQASYSFTVNS